MIKTEPGIDKLETELPATKTRPTTETQPAIYLSKYHPLAMFPHGIEAIQAYGIPPYVEASCRREPDLEHVLPSITAIYHGPKFAPRLCPGDIVVYLTSKGRYDKLPADHWRFTAVLKVLEKFATHEEAADWYRAQGLPLPGNCMVEGNKPLPLEKTCAMYIDDEDKERVPRDVAEWDARYQSIADECPVFLICKPLYIRLKNSPTINDNDVKLIFPNKKMPTARIPSVITLDTMQRLLQTCGIKIAAEEFAHIPG